MRKWGKKLSKKTQMLMTVRKGNEGKENQEQEKEEKEEENDKIK